MTEVRQIKLKTLSAVHIGSGKMLQRGCDFVINDECVYVIDINKMLSAIDSSEIDSVIAMIEKGKDFTDIMQKYFPKKDTSDFAKYSMDLFDNLNQERPSPTLKECLRDGLGRVLIPGSSIKGSIRTAILTHEAKKSDLKSINFAKAANMEKRLFGEEPQKDIFKYLQVGDAYFNANNTILATRLSSLNERYSHPELKDHRMDQLAEVIETFNEAEFRMKTCDKFGYSISEIMKIANTHTQNLIKSEIDYWNDSDCVGYENYVENLKAQLQQSKKCKEGEECVIRIGHGSGWIFTTGAWAKCLNDRVYDEVIDKARPKNYNYKDYDFPKSRRVEDEEESLLGFVKLSLIPPQSTSRTGN